MCQYLQITISLIACVAVVLYCVASGKVDIRILKATNMKPNSAWTKMEDYYITSLNYCIFWCNRRLVKNPESEILVSRAETWLSFFPSSHTSITKGDGAARGQTQSSQTETATAAVCVQTAGERGSQTAGTVKTSGDRQEKDTDTHTQLEEEEAAAIQHLYVIFWNSLGVEVNLRENRTRDKKAYLFWHWAKLFVPFLLFKPVFKRTSDI